eukprot:79941_1
MENVAFPHSVQMTCMTHLDSYLIIIGGFNCCNPIADVFVLNLVLNEWSSGTSLPAARYGHSCHALNQAIYVFGGQSGPQTNDILILQNENANTCCTGQWVKLIATLSNAEKYNRVAVIGTKIYITGGNGLEVDIFDTVTKKVTSYSNMIYIKEKHSVIEANNVIYIFGGEPTTTNNYYQYTYLFPTISPTPRPTTSPTRSSTEPTNNPSKSPTLPTHNPTTSTDNPSNHQRFQHIILQHLQIILPNHQRFQLLILQIIRPIIRQIILQIILPKHQQFQLVILQIIRQIILPAHQREQLIILPIILAIILQHLQMILLNRQPL